MTVYADTFWSQIDMGRRQERLRLRGTHWGIIISEDTRAIKTAHFAEASLKVLAIIILFFSAIPWIYDGWIISDASLVMRLLISAGFFVIGFGVYSHASHGFRPEVHIDTDKQEVRFATRNSRKIASIRRRIPISEIESCYIRRTKTPNTPCQMLLRVRGLPRPVPLVSGKERDLVPLLERSIQTIKSTRQSRLV